MHQLIFFLILLSPCYHHLQLTTLSTAVQPDEDSIEAELVLPPIPNVRGDYGRVSNLTHNYYEAAPAPRICVELILASVAAAGQAEANIFWDLPQDIRYQEPVEQGGDHEAIDQLDEDQQIEDDQVEDDQPQEGQRPAPAVHVLEAPDGFPTSFELGPEEVEPEYEDNHPTVNLL